jgi:hypothetical protein
METVVEQPLCGELDRQRSSVPVLPAKVLAFRAAGVVIGAAAEARARHDAKPPQDLGGAHPPAAEAIGR